MKKAIVFLLNLVVTLIIFYLAYVVVYAFNALVLFWGAIIGGVLHIVAGLLNDEI